MLFRGHVQAEPSWTCQWRTVKQTLQFAVRILPMSCLVKLPTLQVRDQLRVLDLADMCAPQRGMAMQEARLWQGPVHMETYQH